MNIGTGTKVATEVMPAWNKARAFFEGDGRAGTIPLSSSPMLDKMKGHGCTGFHPEHLAACQADNVFRVGDALGLAQPSTGEGILPAVLSGKLCATVIVEGVPETYRKLLRTHPVNGDYRILQAIQTRTKKIFPDKGGEQHLKSGFRDRFFVIASPLLISAKRIPGSLINAKMRK